MAKINKKLYLLLIPFILLLIVILGIFTRRVEFWAVYGGNYAVSVHLESTKPYNELTCGLFLPFDCSTGLVRENSDILRGK